MTTAPSSPAAVTFDLRAAQSPSYRGRGIGRYAVSLALTLARRHRSLLDRVVVDPTLPAPDGAAELGAAGLLTTSHDWETGGGLYHVVGPYDPDAALSAVWPPVVTARRMRFTVHVHDLIPDVLPHIYLADPGRRRRYQARRALVQVADHVLADSASTAADTTRYLGIPTERITVVGGACDDRFAFPADRAVAVSIARSAIGGLGPRWVLYNGAIEPRKQTEELVEAYAALRPSIKSRWQLVVACRLKPGERHHLEVRAAQLGVAGRLVLSGWVDDDVLVALNQGADLVVFPSLYEGFGLPVAEALACGAPVVASAGSALTELVAPTATFEPTRRSEITRALTRALTDQPFRQELLAWSRRPPLRWAEVGDRAAATFRQLLDEAPRPAARPRIALVTPLPPQRTGVADYSAQLATALATRADVDVYVDGDQPGGDPTHAAAGASPPSLYHSGLPPRLLPRAARLHGGYDGVVVALGNSEFHSGGLALLRSGSLAAAGIAPVTLAHDVRLTGLYLHAAARGAVPEGYGAAFAAMYPDRAALLSDGWVPPKVAVTYGILMSRELIDRSAVFATTSPYAAALARLDAAPGQAGRVRVLPYAYPPVVARRSSAEEAGLICSFGIVNANKEPLLLTSAVSLLRPRSLRLVFVGAASDAERETIERHARQVGVNVEVTGFTDAATYESWLQRAAVAVQLRRATNGETSGAVADCLTHGVATIVSAVGPAADLPPAVLKVRPETTAEELAVVVDGLLGDPDRRRFLGLEGQRWVRQRGFDRAADDLLAVVTGLKRATTTR